MNTPLFNANWLATKSFLSIFCLAFVGVLAILLYNGLFFLAGIYYLLIAFTGRLMQIPFKDRLIWPIFNVKSAIGIWMDEISEEESLQIKQNVLSILLLSIFTGFFIWTLLQPLPFICVSYLLYCIYIIESIQQEKRLDFKNVIWPITMCWEIIMNILEIYRIFIPATRYSRLES